VYGARCPRPCDSRSNQAHHGDTEGTEKPRQNAKTEDKPEDELKLRSEIPIFLRVSVPPW